VIEGYLDELGRELSDVGIQGRLRRRILAESEDHLRGDPDAPARFGSPLELANQFAAELGARASRRAAVGAFLALGVAGAVFALAFVGANFAGRPAPDTWSGLAQLALVVATVAPQVSFVAGALALVRSFRRRERVLPSAELTVINRRTVVALLFGLLTMAALAILAIELRDVTASWWVALTVIGTSIAAPLLLLAGVPAVRAARLRPHVSGGAGDVFDDLGFGRTGPWRFACAVAIAVGMVVFLVAAVQGDPFDGALNGMAEALACLGGFAVLGRYLGLRH
jgi:amino acid transporter